MHTDLSIHFLCIDRPSPLTPKRIGVVPALYPLAEGFLGVNKLLPNVPSFPPFPSDSASCSGVDGLTLACLFEEVPDGIAELGEDLEGVRTPLEELATGTSTTGNIFLPLVAADDDDDDGGAAALLEPRPDAVLLGGIAATATLVSTDQWSPSVCFLLRSARMSSGVVRRARIFDEMTMWKTTKTT